MIIQAIENQHPIQIMYSGTERVVNPHALGTNEQGTILLRAFQTAPKPGWKLLDVERTTFYDIDEEEHFDIHPQFAPGDKAMDSVLLAEVSDG